MSAETLVEYVGATSDRDVTFAAQCWAEAHEMVAGYVGQDRLQDVPGPVLIRATLECGSELFHRRQAPNGIMQFADMAMGGTTTRVARDPMLGAYPLLDRWLPGGFA